MTKAANTRAERRGSRGHTAPSSNERLRPPRTPSKAEKAEMDKEDHVEEREDLSEDLSTDDRKGAR